MTPRRPRRRPGENRERLLEAGLVEFGLFGYHGASTTAIAARAEVPQPHVYASFRTKQDLFLACVRVFVADGPPSSRAVGAPAVQADALLEARRAMLLLQAVSELANAQMGAELRELVDACRSREGGDAFELLLLKGARELRNAP